MEDFAALLLSAREKSGMTQAQVAVAAGLTPSYLSFIENRKKPPPSDDVCRRLADVLGIPARRLVDVAHLERAPASLKKRMRSLTHSLKRERRSRQRILESLLSPFLFRGPPGWVESALDTLGLSAKRRRRMREALAAVGRRHQDRAAEVARIVDELSERDRNALLSALPRLLEEQRQAPPGQTGKHPPDDAAAAGTPPAQRTAGSPAADAPPLFSTPPAVGEAPSGPYLLGIDAATAAAAPAEAGIAAGDRVVVDPQLAPRAGDLVVERSAEGATRIGLLVAVAGSGFRIAAGGAVAGNDDAMDEAALRYRLNATGAGTVIEIRRPLRRG